LAENHEVRGHEPRTAVEVLLAYMDVKTKSTGVRLPDVRAFSSFDFDKIPEMYERGRTAASEKLPEIFELLQRDA
jgi:hypothetical protein